MVFIRVVLSVQSLLMVDNSKDHRETAIVRKRVFSRSYSPLKSGILDLLVFTPPFLTPIHGSG